MIENLSVVIGGSTEPGWLTDGLLHLPPVPSTMARKPKSKTSEAAPKKTLQKTTVPKKADPPDDANKVEPLRVSAAALKEASAQNRQSYCKSDRTRKAYTGHVARGKEFLARLVAERRAKDEGVAVDGINTDLLEKAFDNPPNNYSVEALEMFLSWKCFTDGKGHSTAEAIQAAFADYWDNL